MTTAPDFEDVYDLAPLQQALLDRILRGTAEAARCVGHLVVALAPLNPIVFQNAWRRALARHALLRASFYWEGLSKPMQVIRRHAELPLRRQSLTGLPAAAQQRRRVMLLNRARRRAFDLSGCPLLRLTLLRLGRGAFEVILIYHRLILDDRSARLILQEVLDDAAGVLASTGVAAVPSFRDYIQWIRQHDPLAVQRFWQHSLQNLPASTALLGMAGPDTPRPRDAYHKHRGPVAPDLVAAMRDLATAEMIAPEAVVLAAWAIVLGRYAGTNDVNFGISIEGRPPGLDGAQRMIGPFANRLPFRAVLNGHEPLRALLAQTQEQWEQVQLYGFEPSEQLATWAGLAEGLPQNESSVTLGEPTPADLRFHVPGGRAQVLSSSRSVTYPVALTAELEAPNPRLRLLHDATRLDDAAAVWLRRRLDGALAYLAAHPEHRLDELSLLKYAPASPVVELRAGAANAPLFLVPGAGGNALAYAALAHHLGPACGIFAFQPLGQDKGQKPHAQVGAMAGYYLTALRAVQPAGPYVLGGWSMGGLVAYEMAARLIELGERVALLALLDTAASHPDQPIADDLPHALAAIGAGLGMRVDAGNLARRPPRQQALQVLRRAKKRSLVPQDMKVRDLLRLVRLYKAHVQAAQHYVPGPLASRIVLLSTAEQVNDRVDWEKLAPVTAGTVPGNHLSLLREPHVRMVAEQLRAHLPAVPAKVIG